MLCAVTALVPATITAAAIKVSSSFFTANSQAGTASALLEPDGNTLVLWPSTVHTRVNLWAVPPSLMGGVELRHIVRMARGL